MHIRVTANNTNGGMPGHVEWFDDIERAKRHADWWHGQSAVCNVEITEPLGVQLTYANGQKRFEPEPLLRLCMDVQDSWKEVIANRKVNKTRVRQALILGLPVKTAKATAEDHMVGAWMAASLDDIRVPPSMKFDINRWMDSKDWS